MVKYIYEKQDELLFHAVDKFKAGSKSSFNDLYKYSKNYIYKIISDVVTDQSAVEDLMQETYLQIYDKLDTLENSRAFLGWAGRIATSYAYRYYRKRKDVVMSELVSDDGEEFVFETVADDHEEFIPESVVENKEKIRLIGEILNNLSPEQKVAVQLFYYEQMSVRDVAKFCDCSEGTIKSRLNYARKMIKNAVYTLEHKHNTRLYSLASVPLFYLVFRHQAMALAGSAIASMKCVGKAVIKGAKSAANGAKVVAGKAVAIKVAIVAASSSVAVGGTIATVNIVNKDNGPTKEVVAEATTEDSITHTTKPTGEEIVSGVTEPEETEPEETEPEETEPEATEVIVETEHAMWYYFEGSDYQTQVVDDIYAMSTDMGNGVIYFPEPPCDIQYWVNYALDKSSTGINEISGENITDDWINVQGDYFEHYSFGDSDDSPYNIVEYPVRSVRLYVNVYEDGSYWIRIMCSNSF